MNECEQAEALEQAACDLMDATTSILKAASQTVGEVCASVGPQFRSADSGISDRAKANREECCKGLAKVVKKAFAALEAADPERAARVLGKIQAK